MSLQLQLSDLAHLDRIREVLADNDPRGQFSPLGMDQLVIAEDAVDRLVETVQRQLARVGRSGRRVKLVADKVIIKRDGQDLKQLVFTRLAEHFEVSRITLDDGHATLHADEGVQDEAAVAAEGADCIVSVGGGTVTDVAKIAAMRASVPVHVVVQTAASVDGFTDNFSVVLQKGVKRTLLTRWPDAVLTDTRVLAEAPHILNAAGLGELLSMYCAPGDWYLAAQFGIDDTFTPTLVEMLDLCGDGVVEWSAGVGRGEVEGVERLASALAMRGFVTGCGGTSASLSGMEHVVSHMLDMHHAERAEPTGLHGAQVGVGSVVAAAAWEVFCERMEETPLDPARLSGHLESLEGRVTAAFAMLDPSGRLGGECWGHYRQKAAKWNANAAAVARFFADWPTHRERHATLVLPSTTIAACLRKARAPMRAVDLRPELAPGLFAWAVANCQFMRERFTIADLLTFAGWWDADGVERVLARVEASCAAAEAGPS